MSFSLKLLGGVALAGDDGPLIGPASQRHRLALLALLAIARRRGVSREKLMALLWPERDTEPARRLLNQAVHALRQALGASAIVSVGEDLQLDTDVVACDAVAFEEALAAGERERAVALYGGAFLDGFFLDDAPEFERWVERERDRLAGAYARGVEELAEQAERNGEWSAAVDRWKVRAAHDPYDSRIALRLMQALERAGNRAGALHHAAVHQRLLREELEIDPSPEIQALVERLRASQGPVSSRAARETLPPITASPVEHVPPPGRDETAAPITPPARYRRTTWYLTGAMLLAAAIGGALRLAARGGETEVAASPQVVDEIARAVARELDRRTRGDTATGLPRQRTRSIPAYELYLRGDDPALLRSDSGARKGLEYFRRAVALDSSYAAAWVGVARMTIRASGDGPAARAEARVQSEIAARRAVALDDSLAEGHAVLGLLRAMDGDYPMAEQHLRRAVGLEPAGTRVREWFVAFLLMTGRTGEALAEAEAGLAANPLSPSLTAEFARALAANGRCDEALARLKPLEALDPPLLRVAPISARCYGQQGRWAEAIAVLRPQVERDSLLTQALLGYMLGRAGQRAEAAAVQDRLVDRWRRGQATAMQLAYVPAGLGDRDAAFAWLDRAHEDGSLTFGPGYWVDLNDVPFDALREDPRMERLRERLGLQRR